MSREVPAHLWHQCPGPENAVSLQSARWYRASERSVHELSAQDRERAECSDGGHRSEAPRRVLGPPQVLELLLSQQRVVLLSELSAGCSGAQ